MPRTRKPSAELAQSQQGQATTAGLPDLTNEMAIVYAKLLMAGCPAVKAVAYLCPDLRREQLIELSRRWSNDLKVLQAIENGAGPFYELPKDERYRLAYDKHMAELAFFLWTHSFADCAREDVEKMRQAREVLKAEIFKTGDGDDPLQAFSKFASDLMKSVMAVGVAAGRQTPPALSDSFPMGGDDDLKM